MKHSQLRQLIREHIKEVFSASEDKAFKELMAWHAGTYFLEFNDAPGGRQKWHINDKLEDGISNNSDDYDNSLADWKKYYNIVKAQEGGKVEATLFPQTHTADAKILNVNSNIRQNAINPTAGTWTWLATTNEKGEDELQLLSPKDPSR